MEFRRDLLLPDLGLTGGSRFAETQRTTEKTYRLLHGREETAQRFEKNIRNAVFQVAASDLPSMG